MKSVLISIRPKWCELIASGKKTIEVRKTAPKLPTPFKCYIYCTSVKSMNLEDYVDAISISTAVNDWSGKVFGEFVCDLIGFHPGTDVPSSCVPIEELKKYANGKMLARWHISDVKIYDQPRELRSFWKADKCPYATESGCTYKYHCFRAGQIQRCGETLTRPPQSWRYVEEMP